MEYKSNELVGATIIQPTWQDDPGFLIMDGQECRAFPNDLEALLNFTELYQKVCSCHPERNRGMINTIITACFDSAQHDTVPNSRLLIQPRNKRRQLC